VAVALLGPVAFTPGVASAQGAGSNAPLYHLLPKAIQQAGLIIVGTSVAYPPYDFNTANSQTVIGFDPALSHLFGVQLQLHVVQFPALVTGVQSKRFEVAVDGVTDTKVREKVANFVDYGQAGLVILTTPANAAATKNIAAICGKSLAYAQGTYGDQTSKDVASYCKQHRLAAPTVTVFPEAPSIQLALQSGRINYELEDTATGGYDALHSKGKIVSLPIAGFNVSQYNGDFAEADFGVVVPKGQTQLEEAFVKGFQTLLGNGQYAKIYAKWGVSGLAISKITVNHPAY
jgi:polar amino acid transport system substrate-binding protein